MEGRVPNLLERSQGLIDLTLRDNPDTTKYKILVHRNLDSCRTAPTTIITDLAQGSMYRSPTLVRKGLGRTMDSNRGLTRITFDLSDFADGGGGVAPTVPLESEMVYLRVQEFSRSANSYLPSGPMLVIPPTGFFNIRNPLLQIGGTAPLTTSVSLGNPIPAPDGATMAEQMHIVFPFYSQTNNIRNLEKGASHHLWYSSGHSMPGVYLHEQSDFGLTSAAYSEIILAGDNKAADFVVSLGVSTLV